LAACPITLPQGQAGKPAYPFTPNGAYFYVYVYVIFIYLL